MSDGSVKVNGKVLGMEMDDYIVSSGKTFTIYLEMMPDNFALTGYKNSKISFGSISGEIDRYRGDLVDKVALSNSKLDIYNFIGTIKMDGNEINLIGITNSVQGNGFSFSA